MGQFNSGYRRPNFSGSKDFYTSSSSSLAPISASQPKSKKKLLIIIVVAVIVLFIMVLIINNAQKTKPADGLSSSERSYINAYLNWYMDGKESQEKYEMNDENNGNSYFLEITWEGEQQEKTDVIEKTIKKLDAINRACEGAESSHCTLVEQMHAELEVIKANNEKGILDPDEILNLYLTRGKEELLRSIEEFYDENYINTGILPLENYAFSIKEATFELVEFIEDMDEKGCIKHENGEFTCELDEGIAADLENGTLDNSMEILSDSYIYSYIDNLENQSIVLYREVQEK